MGLRATRLICRMTSVLLVSACGGLASRARASVLATAALSSLLLAPASLAATMTQEQVDGSPATVAPATTSDTSGSFALNGIPTTGVDSPPGAADAPGALSGAMITLSVIAVAVVVMGVLVVIVARRRRPSVMRAGSVAGGVRPEARLKDLTSITGSNEIVVTENVVVLGRLRSNSGPGVQGVTLPINTVGRRHAQIEYRLHACRPPDSTSGRSGRCARPGWLLSLGYCMCRACRFCSHPAPPTSPAEVGREEV